MRRFDFISSRRRRQPKRKMGKRRKGSFQKDDSKFAMLMKEREREREREREKRGRRIEEDAQIIPYEGGSKEVQKTPSKSS
jgi:hypothetical protein